MKLKRTIAAVTAAMLTMSAINFSGISAEEVSADPIPAEQSYAPAAVEYQTGGFEKPVFELVSEEQMENIRRTAELNNERIANSTPRRLYAQSRTAYTYSSDYYYNQITSAAGKKLYDDIVDACNAVLNSSADITYSYKNDYYLDYIECGSGITEDEAYQITLAVYYSNPQFFFLNGGAVWSSYDNGYAESIAPRIQNDFADGLKRQACKAQIQSITNEWMAEINTLESDFDKELRIAEKLCRHISYDLSAPHHQTIAGALVDKKCVCNGYAMAMAYFCNAAGMESFLVTSNTHAWIDIYLDGAWHEVDVTWMDDNDYNTINYTWLNRSHSTFLTYDSADGDHEINTQMHSGILDVPTCEDYWELCTTHTWSPDFGISDYPCNDDYWSPQTCEKCFVAYYNNGTYTVYPNSKVDHKFSLTDYDETNHWQECEYGCGTKDGEEAHTAKAAFETDGTYHWHACINENCGAELDYEEHTYTDGVCKCGTEVPNHNHEGGTATCTDKAVCDICGSKYGELKDHAYNSGTVTKDPTCTEKGVKTFTCKDCGDTKTEEIDMVKHTEVIDEAVAPTCTETGLTAGSHCSVCDTVIKEQEEVPAAGHNPVKSGRVEPTCEDDGMTEGTKCSVCNTIIDATEIIPSLGHAEVIDAAVEPTCTKTGLTEGKHCSRCEKTLVEQEVIEKLPHTEVTVEGTEPTCTGTGLTEKIYCSVCDTVIKAQEVIPANGHTEAIDAAVAPTCAESGLTEGKHCSVCDEILVAQQTLDETGHRFVDGVCSVCGTEADPDCEHIGGDWKKSAEGHYKICESCGAQIEFASHEWGEFTVTAEADCENNGSKAHSCTVCDFEETEVIEKLGHNYENGKCTVCGASDPDYTAPAPEAPSGNGSAASYPSTTVNYPTVVPVGYEAATPEQITEKINSSADGETVEVNLTGNTSVDKSVIESIAGKDITVVIKMTGGSYWTINGKDIEKSRKVDLGVRIRNNLIPDDKISAAAGDNKTIQFSLRHNGDFGFKGVLNLPISAKYNGKYANLFYYNNGSLDFVGSSYIAKGTASFAFTHASDYLIVIDDHAYGEDVSTAAGVYGDTESASDHVYVAIIAAAAVLGAAVLGLKKRARK